MKNIALSCAVLAIAINAAHASAPVPAPAFKGGTFCGTIRGTTHECALEISEAQYSSDDGWFVSIERPIRTSSASYSKSADLCASIWARYGAAGGEETITVTSDASCRPTSYKFESPSLSYVCENLQRSWSRAN